MQTESNTSGNAAQPTARAIPQWVSAWNGWPKADKLRYWLACEQPQVKSTGSVVSMVYRWCRTAELSERHSALGRHVVCGSFIAYPAVVDDFGSLLRVPS